MNSKELAKNLIDQILESKMYYIIACLQEAALPEEVPNTETLEAIHKLESGGGTVFAGSTESFFAELMEHMSLSSNLTCINYADVRLLPYYSGDFQDYRGQEIRYQLGEKIRMNIIIHSLGQTIETIK